MKNVVILDSDPKSTHPMEAVLERRGFLVLRAGSADETIDLLKKPGASIDLVIADVPLGGSASETEAPVKIQQSSPEIPILLISEKSLDKWAEEDFMQFGRLLSGRVDLLVKPLSQASFVSKTNALIYTISYSESKRLFNSAAARRLAAASGAASLAAIAE